MELTRDQRKARDGLADVHRDSPSVEQYFGSLAEHAPYGTLVLRFENPDGGIPRVYVIDQEGRTTITEPWP